MILEIIIILTAIAIIALTANHFENRLSKEKSKISIKESIDLVKLPIITFQCDNESLNFLLDSGSSESHISETASKALIGTPIDTDYAFTTSTGSDTASKLIEAILKYKNEEFKIDLFINKGLDGVFNGIKSECGVQLHGILGTDFLRNHKYILDFAKLVAYHK